MYHLKLLSTSNSKWGQRTGICSQRWFYDSCQSNGFVLRVTHARTCHFPHKACEFRPQFITAMHLNQSLPVMQAWRTPLAGTVLGSVCYVWLYNGTCNDWTQLALRVLTNTHPLQNKLRKLFVRSFVVLAVLALWSSAKDTNSEQEPCLRWMYAFFENVGLICQTRKLSNLSVHNFPRNGERIAVSATAPSDL